MVVPARRPEIARAALAGMPGSVEWETLGLVDADSIDAFAQRFRSSERPLDLLVGAAGVMALPLQRDRAGNEMQLSAGRGGEAASSLRTRTQGRRRG